MPDLYLSGDVAGRVPPGRGTQISTMSSSTPSSLRRRRLLLVLCVVLLVPATGAAAQEEPPAEGLIAFTAEVADPAGEAGASLDDGLFAADFDGATKRLTDRPAEGVADRFPRWHPGGRWLAFTRTTGPDRQPMAVSTDGEEVALAEHGYHPTWSPDGDLLAWAVAGPLPGIVVTQVTDTAEGLELGEQRLLEMPQRPDAPVFSPDGSAVLFRMRRSSASQASDLWTVRLDGSDPQRLTSDVDASAGPVDGHSWSPDGTRIVFLAADAASRGGHRAHIVNRDGTQRRLLFPASNCEFTRAAEWAPHGEFLAVLQSCQEEGFVLVSPEGRRLGAVAAGDLRFAGTAFAPDAASLYAVAVAADATTQPVGGELLQIPLDGSNSRVLVAEPAVELSAIGVVATSEVEPRVVLPPAPPEEEPTPTDPKVSRPKLELACPSSEVPYADFLDVDLDAAHRVAIDCMAWWDVVSGVEQYRYGPGESISRGQMASLLTRLVTAGGGFLPSSTVDYFDDDGHSPHEGNINRLAKAGIARGAQRGRFRPGADVSRDQMASLIVATYAYLDADPLLGATRDYFADDDTSVHEGTINLAAENGFVSGQTADVYEPAGAERRDQAASRAARILDALVEQDRVTPPREGLARVTKVVDGDTVLANDPEVGTIRIRFVGINAPEAGTCGADAATEMLRSLVGNRTIRLSSDDPSSIGYRERPLRFVEVYLNNRWVDVNGAMLASGHAVWFPNEEGKEPRNNNLYQSLTRRAMAADRGLWDRDWCGIGPEQGADLQVWVRTNPQSAGTRDLTGEWVRIANRGASTVDLAGWLVRDSSAKPAYVLGADSLLAPGETMTLHVGDGIDEALVRYWGRSESRFAGVISVQGQWVGDAAYLMDPLGNIRAGFLYPCIEDCTDPLMDKVDITNIWRGLSSDETDQEAVDVRNVSDETISLHGYRLVSPPYDYALPADSVLAPGETLQIRTGVGDDTSLVKYWGKERHIFADAQGIVALRTYDGVQLSCLAWGDAVCD